MGSVADYLEVDGATSARSKPASAICSSTSSFATHEQAAAGLRLAEAHNAGRVGFLVAEPPTAVREPGDSAGGSRADGRSPRACSMSCA